MLLSRSSVNPHSPLARRSYSVPNICCLLRFFCNKMTKIKLERAARIILVGAPGVGKGTQAERLMNRFPQLSAVSSGDLLRDNVHNKTPLGT